MPDTTQEQLTEQQQQILNQQKILSNPNLLRAAGLGYLLAPAYKSKFYEYKNQLGQSLAANQQQQADYQNYLNQLKAQQEERAQPRQVQIGNRTFSYRDYQVAKKFSENNLSGIGLTQNQKFIYKQLREGAVARQRDIVEFQNAGGKIYYDESGKIIGTQSPQYKQELPPVRIIDTSAGSIKIVGGNAWEKPATEILKTVSFEPNLHEAVNFNLQGGKAIVTPGEMEYIKEINKNIYTQLGAAYVTSRNQIQNQIINQIPSSIRNDLKDIYYKTEYITTLPFRAGKTATQELKDFDTRISPKEFQKQNEFYQTLFYDLPSELLFPQTLPQLAALGIGVKTLGSTSPSTLTTLSKLGLGGTMSAASAYDFFNTESNTQKLKDLVFFGMGLGVVKNTLGEKIIVRKFQKPEVITDYQEIRADIFQTDKLLESDARFSVYSYQQAQLGYETTRLEKLKYDIQLLKPAKPIGEMTAQEISSLIKGNIVEISEPSVAMTMSDTLKIKNGKLQGIIYSKAATPTKETPIIESVLRGVNYGEQISPSDLKILQMDKINSALFDRLAVETKTFGFKLYPKNTFLSVGEINVQDFLRITDTSNIFIPYGRRTTRLDIGFLTKPEIVDVKFNKEYGLTEAELIKGYMSFIDETYPRVPRAKLSGDIGELYDVVKPKKVGFMKGETLRFEFNIPGISEGSDLIIMGGKKSSGNIFSQTAQAQAKTNQILKNTFPLMQEKAISAITQRALIEDISPKSIWEGTGLYERTESALGFAEVVSNLNMPKSLSITEPKFSMREIVREINRIIPKEIPREIPKETSKDIVRELNRQTQRENQKEEPKIIIKEIPREPGNNNPFGFNTGTNIFPKEDLFFNNRRRRRFSRNFPAYNVQIKKGKRFVPVAFGLPRGKALKFGSEKVLRDLSRQFKITSSGYTNLKDIDFFPSEKQFRQYKVKKGKRIDLPFGNFIQKTKSLLQSPEEKMLIKMSRRKLF